MNPLNEVHERICTTCKEMKPLNKFGHDDKGRWGVRSVCRTCENAKSRAWRQTAKRRRALARIEAAKAGAVTTCAGCKKSKSILDFHKHLTSRANGCFSYCKSCVAAGHFERNRTLRERWMVMRREARRKRWPESDIGHDEYCAMVGPGVCHYCGGRLNPTGSGLDRKDPKIGYMLDNVVPCCNPCNTAKYDEFSYEQMFYFIGPAIRDAKMWANRRLERESK